MKRIQYIDCMRGMTMILVVYSHVIVYSYKIDDGSFLNFLFLMFRMPLFFFISGFLAYTFFDLERFKKKFKKRLFGQLTPTFVMLALYEIWINKTDFSGFSTNYKHGYWFTIVVFILFFFFACISVCLDKLKTKRYIKATVFLLTAIGLSLAYYRIPSFTESSICKALSLPLAASYAPFYSFGMLSKMFYEKYKFFITNSWIITGNIFAFIIVYLSPIPDLICSFFAILVIHAMFHHYQGYFSEDTKIGRSLSYIGKNTISIYFFHYFAFKYFQLNWLASFLIDNDMQLFGGFLTLLIALFVIVLCLLAERAIAICKPIYWLMLGKY